MICICTQNGRGLNQKWVGLIRRWSGLIRCSYCIFIYWDETLCRNASKSSFSSVFFWGFSFVSSIDTDTFGSADKKDIICTRYRLRRALAQPCEKRSKEAFSLVTKPDRLSPLAGPKPPSTRTVSSPRQLAWTPTETPPVWSTTSYLIMLHRHAAVNCT